MCASCQMPVISKSFELQIQVGGGKGSNKVGFYIVFSVKRRFFFFIVADRKVYVDIIRSAFNGSRYSCYRKG